MQCQRPSPWTYASGTNTYCRAWRGALQPCVLRRCVPCAVGTGRAHHAPLRELDLALGQVGRPAARRVEAVPARVVQAVFGFECRDHYICESAAHGRLRVDPAGSFADVGAGLPWLTEHPAVVGHEDARAPRLHGLVALVALVAHPNRNPKKCRPLDCAPFELLALRNSLR